MTEDEIVKAIEEMVRWWPNLPNPEHEPKRFQMYVKLYKHLKSR